MENMDRKVRIKETRTSKDECSTGDQTIIVGRQIFLDRRSLSSIGQKILMMLGAFVAIYF